MAACQRCSSNADACIGSSGGAAAARRVGRVQAARRGRCSSSSSVCVAGRMSECSACVCSAVTCIMRVLVMRWQLRAAAAVVCVHLSALAALLPGLLLVCETRCSECTARVTGPAPVCFGRRGVIAAGADVHLLSSGVWVCCRT